ncbi:MAG: hypothetical protein ABSH49_28625, partial [Bryobacteraceae bacterium]
MKRNLCLCLALLCFQAGRAAAQCSSAPASLSATCGQLQGYLDSFNTTVSAGWNGVKTPVAFAAEATTADCNRGPATLLAPGTFAQVLSQLNAFALLGVQSVTTCIGFPILYHLDPAHSGRGFWSQCWVDRAFGSFLTFRDNLTFGEVIPK